MQVFTCEELQQQIHPRHVEPNEKDSHGNTKRIGFHLKHQGKKGNETPIPWSHPCHQLELASSSSTQQEHFHPAENWRTHAYIKLGQYHFEARYVSTQIIKWLTAIHTTLTAEGTATRGFVKCFWASKNPSAELWNNRKQRVRAWLKHKCYCVRSLLKSLNFKEKVVTDIV